MEVPFIMDTIWLIKNSAKEEWTAKERFSIIAKILFLKFPLEDGGEGIHLNPPPPMCFVLPRVNSIKLRTSYM